jgi:hypothetical protein
MATDVRQTPFVKQLASSGKLHIIQDFCSVGSVRVGALFALLRYFVPCVKTSQTFFLREILMQ